jgi:predicted nuclease of predicted toxin-antitoxin system
LRLLIDEMYAPDIAEQLRARGHDAVSVAERADLRSAPDEVVFDVAQAEHRVIVTNNVRDFVQPVQQVFQRDQAFYGIVFTSDRSLPRSRATIGSYLDLLHSLLVNHSEDERLPAGIEWLP